MSDKKPSIEELEAKGEGGDVESMIKLALMYLSDDNDGYDLDGFNVTEARKWFKLASDSGSAIATFYLACLLDDRTKTMNLLKKAASMGCLEAQQMIGLIYSRRGDFENSLFWFKPQYENAEAGAFFRGMSAFEIGRLYQKRGSYRDYVKAVKWYKTAAGMGFSVSARRLGELYETGVRSDEYITDSADNHTIIQQDEKEAAKWYLVAAENGSEGDCAKMSDLYLNGIGVIRNYRNAFLWMLKAACYPYSTYRSRVSWFYEKGKGIEQNYYEAYVWALMVRDNHNADKINELEGKLSQEETDKAQKEAEYRTGLVGEYVFSKALHDYMLTKIDSTDMSSVTVNEIKPVQPALPEDDKEPFDGSDSSANKSAMNTPSQKLHRSGLDYSSWKVGRINDIKVTFYLRDATITLSYKNKKDTQPADKLFSINSLRLLILAYNYIQTGHDQLKKAERTIASAAYPNKYMADCLPNNRVVTYFNSDFRKLFGLSKKDKAFDWDGGRYNSYLVANIILEVKP